jgi:surfeit locus 1 family protein
MITPILFGLIGAGVLIGLGVWQLQRLHWKEGILAQIEARMADAPVALPPAPDSVADRYLPVAVTGRFSGEPLFVLTSDREAGPGYRVIQAFETADRRRIMIDRGFMPEGRRGGLRTDSATRVEGTLHWPDETDSFTPPPDTDRGLWFARDVPGMAAALRTEPVLVVASSDTGDGITPIPVDTTGIPNNHLHYAITWFCLAVVWLGMTVLLLWRIRRRTD